MKSAKPRAVETLAALAAVLRAAIRVGWYESRSPLPELARRLRVSGRQPVDGNPAAALPVVEALLPVLPPLGAGRCLKRSLLLLDLWSRAGLEPELHLGYRRGSASERGHAWITTRGGLSTFRPADVDELWSG